MAMTIVPRDKWTKIKNCMFCAIRSFIFYTSMRKIGYPENFPHCLLQKKHSFSVQFVVDSVVPNTTGGSVAAECPV